MAQCIDGRRVIVSGIVDTTANPGSLTSLLNTIRELQIGKFLKVCEVPQDEGKIMVYILSTDVLDFEVLKETLYQSLRNGQLSPWKKIFSVT